MDELISKEYKDFIEEVLKDFKKSQIKAAVQVNSEMLKFYWRIGETRRNPS